MATTFATDFTTILVDIADDDVATITLNRPERLNAAPPKMFEEINEALMQLPASGARVVLFTGAGRAFCSGADLAGRDDDLASRGPGYALDKSYNPCMRALAGFTLPIVAAVNGPAAGIGCSLALAADFVVAAKSAYFLQAFVNIGLVPDGGASWMLPRLIGKARAAEMMMLGERIPAEKAQDWGMIYKAVDDAALMNEARALAVRLAKGPTVALGLMRAALHHAMELDYAHALAEEVHNQVKAGRSEDAREGMSAFLEKRAPEFKGR